MDIHLSPEHKIANKIEEGWLAAERGELVGDEEIKARMLARKKDISPCHLKTTESDRFSLQFGSLP